jgi:hypothetical protein
VGAVCLLGIPARQEEMDMVTKTTDDGKGFYHEPPCTEEEEDDFYRRVGGGPVSILHAPKKPKPKDDEEI